MKITKPSLREMVFLFLPVQEIYLIFTPQSIASLTSTHGKTNFENG